MDEERAFARLVVSLHAPLEHEQGTGVLGNAGVRPRGEVELSDLASAFKRSANFFSLGKGRSGKMVGKVEKKGMVKGDKGGNWY